THEGCDGRIDLAAGAGIVDLKLHSESAGGRFYVCQHGRCIRRVSRIDQYRDAGCRRQQLTQQSQPLSIDLRTERIDAGRIAARMGETGNKAELDRILADAEDDWNCVGRSCGHRAGTVPGAAITLTCRRTRSAAISASRSTLPSEK